MMHLDSRVPVVIVVAVECYGPMVMVVDLVMNIVILAVPYA
jgi:hypothetical protein